MNFIHVWNSSSMSLTFLKINENFLYIVFALINFNSAFWKFSSFKISDFKHLIDLFWFSFQIKQRIDWFISWLLSRMMLMIIDIIIVLLVLRVLQTGILFLLNKFLCLCCWLIQRNNERSFVNFTLQLTQI